MMKRRALSIAILGVLLTGCASVSMKRDVDEHARIGTNYTSFERSQYGSQVRDSYGVVGQSVNRPWVTGKAQPLARDASLPPALRANVNTVMLFEDGATDLLGLAQRIQMATGILVQVKPDALLPIDQFLPRIEAAGGAGGSALIQRPDEADTLIPSISLLLREGDRYSGPNIGAGPQGVIGQLKNLQLKGASAPLSRILDAISLRLGVYWEFDSDLAAIVFYRTQTKTFTLRVQDLNAESDSDLGLASGTGGSTTSGGGQFRSASRTAFSMDEKDNPNVAIVRKVTQFLTRAGKVEYGGGGNTIIVTDTKDALSKVEKFIEEENKVLTRRVRLLFEEITLQIDDRMQGGINWSAIYQSANKATRVGIFGPGGALSPGGAPMDLSVGVGQGQWKGSQVSIQALSEVGKVVRRTSIPLLGLNRRPATYAARNSFYFINEMEQTSNSNDSSGPTVTAKQLEETVGTFLTIIPDAQSDGQVLLTLNYNDSRLVALNREELGSNSFVQQPEVSAQGMTQQVELRPGQPTLVAGFEQQSNQYKERRTDPRAPLLFGGGDDVNNKSQITLLFITAIPEEGY